MFRQVARGCALAIALLVVHHSAAAAIAQEPGTVAVMILPAGGNPRGIQLKAQTVDVVIEDQDGMAWADTTVWLLLHNPSSKAITVPVTLPGPQLRPGKLPSDLKLSLGKLELPTAPLPETQDAGPQLTANVRVPKGASVELRATYRQVLPETGGIAAFAYMMETAKQWAGVSESLRISVHLRAPITRAQLLDVVPPPKYADGDSLTWSWEGERGLTSVAMALFSPARWSGLRTAGLAAEAASAGPSQHLALAEQYLALAELPLLPFESPGSRNRFLLSGIGELQAAVSRPSTDISAQTRARLALAELSRGGSEAATGSYSEVDLQNTAAEIGRGLELDPADPKLKVMAHDVYTKLADLLTQRGDIEAAAQYSARLAALESASAADPRLSKRLDEAEAALRRGDVASARGLVAELSNATMADQPALPRARLKECLIKVTTRPGGRTITMDLSAGPDDVDEVTGIVQRSLRSLEGIQGAMVRASGTHLEISLPADPVSASVMAIQQQLAAALPDDPELALLAAVLLPESVSIGTSQGLIWRDWAYTERADLQPAAMTWQKMADQFTAASDQPSGQAGAGNMIAYRSPDERLDALRVAMTAIDADSWRRLLTNSRVTYRVEAGGSGTFMEWEVPAGSTRVLEMRSYDWDLTRIRWAIGAALAATALAAIILWRVF